MRALSCCVFSLFILLAGEALADPAPRINAQGTFTEVGVWMYHTDDNKFRNGQGIQGSNESIVMPSPAPQYGETLVAITHIHHPRDRMRYPVHISLIEKAFANYYKVQLFSSGSDNMMWRYDPGTPFGVEHGSTDAPAQAEPLANYKLTGPIPGTDAPPPPYLDAVAYLKGALASIENLPAAQKSLADYVVMFAETDDTIWMEIAPVPAPGESLHLGCQMQNGRDMVFGYEKRSVNGGHGGPWLQCY